MNYFKYFIKKIKDFNSEKIIYLINFEKYKNFKNLRKLGKILSFASIISNIFFYIGIFSYINLENNSYIIFFLTTFITLNFYLVYLFLNGSSPYENTKGIFGAGISMIFISPFGGVMLGYCSNDAYGKYDPKLIYKKNFSIFSSFANSFSNLEKDLKNALNYIMKKHPDEFQIFLKKNLNISCENYQNGDNKTKYFILALSLALKQNKKNSFNEIIFKPHWYDEKFFDFAIKDKRAEITVVKYIYSIAFIILDEFNNYQKILNTKKEIKRNLKFSPAKVICLHGGTGYKVYVNG